MSGGLESTNLSICSKPHRFNKFTIRGGLFNLHENILTDKTPFIHSICYASSISCLSSATER